jgi:hypothetical protein
MQPRQALHELRHRCDDRAARGAARQRAQVAELGDDALERAHVVQARRAELAGGDTRRAHAREQRQHDERVDGRWQRRPRRWLAGRAIAPGAPQAALARRVGRSLT